MCEVSLLFTQICVWKRLYLSALLPVALLVLFAGSALAGQIPARRAAGLYGFLTFSPSCKSDCPSYANYRGKLLHYVTPPRNDNVKQQSTVFYYKTKTSKKQCFVLYFRYFPV